MCTGRQLVKGRKRARGWNMSEKAYVCPGRVFARGERVPGGLSVPREHMYLGGSVPWEGNVAKDGVCPGKIWS
jgi:hypothetical protein